MKKRFLNDLGYICFFSIIFSSLGFVIENSARILGLGIVDSRFHFLPFIAAYGLIPFAAYIIGDGNHLIKIKNHKKLSLALSNALYLLIIISFVFVGEIVVGTLYEKLVGVKLWDYSKKLGHITNYTCPMSFLGFGIGGFFIIKLFFPLFNKLKKTMSLNSSRFFVFIYLFIMLDEVTMMNSTMVLHETPTYYSFYVGDTNRILFIVQFIITYSILSVSIIGFIRYVVNTFNTKKKYEITLF